jgi:hypothetical protein
VYVKEKMEEISTSFCFICLLHLANERGLKLEGGEEGMIAAVEDDDELDTSAIKTTDKGVGDIWSLKVRFFPCLFLPYADPTFVCRFIGIRMQSPLPNADVFAPCVDTHCLVCVSFACSIYMLSALILRPVFCMATLLMLKREMCSRSNCRVIRVCDGRSTTDARRES